MVTWQDIVKEAPTGGDFIQGPEKETLYEEQIAFAIINARPKTETSFGPQTQFIVRLSTARDVDRNLPFTHNEYREGVAKQVLKVIEAGNGPVGPCFLRKFRTSNGNNAWEISGEPLEPKPGKSSAPASGGGVSSQAIAGDDLPFLASWV